MLKELKEENFEIVLSGQTYNLRLDMNALCELEEIYGSINDALTSFKEKPIKAMRNFLYVMLKSDKDSITINEVGKLVKINELEETLKKLGEVLEKSFPAEGEDEKATVKKTKK